jgi:hypothetical protein
MVSLPMAWGGDAGGHLLAQHLGGLGGDVGQYWACGLEVDQRWNRKCLAEHTYR